MADYTNRGEYRSPRARRVYKAPKKKKTEGEKLEESGQYLKDPETEVDTSQPLQSSTNPLDSLFIDKKKFRKDVRQKKIRDLSERPGTESEGQAAKDMLRDKTQLPDFGKYAMELTGKDIQEIEQLGVLQRRQQDKEKYSKTDQLIREGKLDEVHQQHPDINRKALYDMSIGFADQLVELKSDWEAFKLGAKTGAGIGFFLPDGPFMVAGEGVGALVGGTTAVALKNWTDFKLKTTFARGAKWIANKITGKPEQVLVGPDGNYFSMQDFFDDVDNHFNNAKPLQMSGSNATSGFGSTIPTPKPSQVTTVTRKLLNEKVLIGKNRTFDYNAFKGLFTGDKRGRLLEQWMQTTPGFKIKNWNKHRKNLVDVFESIYGDVMKAKNITRRQIQIDHLVTLRSTMPVYDGVAFGSPLWTKIQQKLLRSKNKYKPGNTLDNLDALDPGSHISKTNFFNAKFGKDGEKFFTNKRLSFMKKSEANRMKVLEDWLKIQDEGTEILSQAKTVWETLYKSGTELPENLITKLADIKIGEYSHPELKKIITEIIETGGKPGPKTQLSTFIDQSIKSQRRDGGKYYQPTLDPKGGTFIK